MLFCLYVLSCFPFIFYCGWLVGWYGCGSGSGSVVKFVFLVVFGVWGWSWLILTSDCVSS